MTIVQHQLAYLNFNLLYHFSYRNGDFTLIEVEKTFPVLIKLYLEKSKLWDLVLNEPELTDRDYIENKGLTS